MVKAFFTIAILFITFSITGCQHDATQAELFAKFYANKPSLDSLVISIHSDKQLDSILSSRIRLGIPDVIKENYPVQFKLIKKLGIATVLAFPNTFKSSKSWLYFTTNWSEGSPINLIYNYTPFKNNAKGVPEIDTLLSTKGYYSIDQNKDEKWGLGGGWMMLRDVHRIRRPKI